MGQGLRSSEIGQSSPSPWVAARTREAITREAQSRRIPIGPVRTPAELLADPQYAARGFVGAGGMPAMPFRANGVRPHG